MTYKLKSNGTILFGEDVLHRKQWRWSRASQEIISAPTERTFDSARAAIGVLGKDVGLRHLVIGVIGPREATEEQKKHAFHVGQGLAALGLTMICGGRGGVMEAAAEGCTAAGGLSIGLLPGSTPDEANPHIAIPLPTGFGEGRNMIIAKAARALIAVGGSYGTLSEIAYGLHFGKPVFTLSGAPSIQGTLPFDDPEQAIDALCRSLLTPPAMS